MEQLYLQKENYFGKKIYFPIATFRNHPKLESFIQMQLIPLFKELGLNPDKTFNSIVDICNDYLEQYKTQGNSINKSLTDLTEGAEKELHRTFDFFDFAQINRLNEIQRIKQLKARAEKIYRQIRVPIKKYLDGREIKLLDMGCGDGMVTWVLRRHEKDLNIKFKRTYLADVVGDNFPDYRVQEVKNNEKDYPFIPLSPIFSNLDIPNGDGPIRLDCILLLTVLHHCTNPEEVFRTCWKFLNNEGIIIAIESCVGISSEFVRKNLNTAGKNIYTCNGQKHTVEKFLTLSPEEEIMYATFIDWFYNRVLHQDVIVSYNFTSPGAWNDRFEKYHQIVCKETYCEGFDQLTVPEFHTLHVLRKEKRE